MSSLDNFKGVMKNDKQRTILIVTGILVVVMLLVGLYYVSKNKSNNKPVTPSVSVGDAPSMVVLPGKSKSVEYNKAQRDVNEQTATTRLAEGKSFDPTITNNELIGGKSVIDALNQSQADKIRQQEAPVETPVEVVVPPPPAPVTVEVVQPAPIVAMPVVAPAPAPAPAPMPAVKQPNYGMDQFSLISTLAQSFKNKKSAIETDYTSGQNGSKEGQDGNVASNGNGNGNGNAGSNAQPENVLFKAGDMINAVLETAINSDEPSPVLARVIGGQYNGARAVCSIQRNGEKALVECKKLAIDGYPRSVNVNLVAIDPNTTRTGLATSVDHHYFEKYVVGLGATFLKGYADALSRQNTSTAITGSGSLIVSQGQLNSGEIVKSGLGEVGKTIAEDSRNKNIKPTVYVSAGTAIGLMALDDIVVK